VWPGGSAPAVFGLGVGSLVLISGSDAFGPRVFLLVLGLHLTIELAALVGDVPWTSPVELRVLTASAWAFSTVQALGQLTAFAGLWASSRPLTLTWLPVASGIAVAAMAGVILTRLRSGA